MHKHTSSVSRSAGKSSAFSMLNDLSDSNRTQLLQMMSYGVFLLEAVVPVLLQVPKGNETSFMHMS